MLTLRLFSKAASKPALSFRGEYNLSLLGCSLYKHLVKPSLEQKLSECLFTRQAEMPETRGGLSPNAAMAVSAPKRLGPQVGRLTWLGAGQTQSCAQLGLSAGTTLPVG